MKTTIRLFTIPLLAICGGLVVQGQVAPSTSPPPVPAPPQALPAPKPPEPVLWDKLEGPRTQQQLRSVQPAPPNAEAGVSGRYGAAGGGYGLYGGYAGAPPGSGATFSDRLQHIIKRASGPAPQPSRLIIRSSAMDPKEQATLGEDLAVMAHILNKAIDESSGNRPPTAMGIDLFGGAGPAGSRMLYLEDYGAVFTLNVGIPLVPAKPGPEKKKEDVPADNAWEEAKRELYGQGGPPAAAGTPVEGFSSDRVEKLTDALVDALRNARNIRGLKSDDSITLCVLGAPAAPETPGRRDVLGGPPSVPPLAAGYVGPQKGTVMTVRVKKSDTDAFANGSLKADEFRKQIRIERYEDGISGAAVMSGGVGAMSGGIGYSTGGGF